MRSFLLILHKFSYSFIHLKLLYNYLHETDVAILLDFPGG